MTPEERIRSHLQFLYPGQGDRLSARLLQRLEDFAAAHPQLAAAPPAAGRLTHRDAILITYGDQVREPDRPPLQTLSDFLDTYLGTLITGIHILPFYPYSSDDGFSVIDYRRVDENLGGWEDIQALGSSHLLMFDAVINHISRHSDWFQAFLRGDPRYQDYFITVPPDTDLSQVVRPRALPLLTPIETSAGTRHVWTTFSDDQIDLNYANPEVLFEIIDLLLFYTAHAASLIRLDAIAYLWKEIGTPCIHLEQTHRVVKLFRAVLDAVAPGVILITETNVPHAENISYFGGPLPERAGTDEAQLVYQFPLAPLVLHTYRTGRAETLADWAASLESLPGTTFFNFIASHDGIGVRPAEGLLSPEEIQALVEQTLDHGGQVSYKQDPGGSRSVYELNITLYDALNDPRSPNQPLDVRRFLGSQAIMLSLAGVPGIYFPSFFGSPNCHACVEETGRLRSINRQKFDLVQLQQALGRPNSRTAQVFAGYRRLLEVRCDHPAFHPFAPQEVLRLGAGVFALHRSSPDGQDRVVCLVEVSGQPRQIRLDLTAHGLPESPIWVELLHEARHQNDGGQLTVHLEPYQVAWLSPLG